MYEISTISQNIQNCKMFDSELSMDETDELPLDYQDLNEFDFNIFNFSK
jgi:hypothetical protein